MKSSIAVIVLGALLLPMTALAQAPSTITYQGRIDSAGAAIKMPKNLTFAIYNVAVGGAALWTETQTNVGFTNGLFTVQLGTVTPFPSTLFTDLGERWLGVTVAGASEMSPRALFRSSPYALRAATADNVADNAITSAKIADGAVATADIAAGAVSTTTIADGAVTSAKIVDAGVATADLADNSVTSAKIAVNTIVSADLAASAVATANIADAAVTSAKIADLTVTSSDLATGAVTTSIIGDGMVTGAKIADLTITAADISDNSLTSAKIADGTIASADLAVNAVATGNIAGNAVTSAKILDEPGVQWTSGGGGTAISTTSTTSQVSSVTINAPTAGYVIVTASGSLYWSVSATADGMARIRVSNSPNDVSENPGLVFIRFPAGMPGGIYTFPYSTTMVFPVSAGANTFYLNIWHQLVTGTLQLDDYVLVATFVPTRY